MKKINNYINGKNNQGSSKKTLPVFDPSTGERQAEVILSNNEDFQEALESSKKVLMNGLKLLL